MNAQQNNNNNVPLRVAEKPFTIKIPLGNLIALQYCIENNIRCSVGPYSANPHFFSALNRIRMRHVLMSMARDEAMAADGTPGDVMVMFPADNEMLYYADHFVNQPVWGHRLRFFDNDLARNRSLYLNQLTNSRVFVDCDASAYYYTAPEIVDMFAAAVAIHGSVTIFMGARPLTHAVGAIYLEEYSARECKSLVTSLRGRHRVPVTLPRKVGKKTVQAVQKNPDGSDLEAMVDGYANHDYGPQPAFRLVEGVGIVQDGSVNFFASVGGELDSDYSHTLPTLSVYEVKYLVHNGILLQTHVVTSKGPYSILQIHMETAPPGVGDSLTLRPLRSPYFAMDGYIPSVVGAYSYQVHKVDPRNPSSVTNANLASDRAVKDCLRFQPRLGELEIFWKSPTKIRLQDLLNEWSWKTLLRCAQQNNRGGVTLDRSLRVSSQYSFEIQEAGVSQGLADIFARMCVPRPPFAWVLAIIKGLRELRDYVATHWSMPGLGAGSLWDVMGGTVATVIATSSRTKAGRKFWNRALGRLAFINRARNWFESFFAGNKWVQRLLRPFLMLMSVLFEESIRFVGMKWYALVALFEWAMRLLNAFIMLAFGCEDPVLTHGRVGKATLTLFLHLVCLALPFGIGIALHYTWNMFSHYILFSEFAEPGWNNIIDQMGADLFWDIEIEQYVGQGQSKLPDVDSLRATVDGRPLHYSDYNAVEVPVATTRCLLVRDAPLLYELVQPCRSLPDLLNMVHWRLDPPTLYEPDDLFVTSVWETIRRTTTLWCRDPLQLLSLDEMRHYVLHRPWPDSKKRQYYEWLTEWEAEAQAGRPAKGSGKTDERLLAKLSIESWVSILESMAGVSKTRVLIPVTGADMAELGVMVPYKKWFGTTERADGTTAGYAVHHITGSGPGVGSNPQDGYEEWFHSTGGRMTAKNHVGIEKLAWDQVETILAGLGDIMPGVCFLYLSAPSPADVNEATVFCQRNFGWTWKLHGDDNTIWFHSTVQVGYGEDDPRVYHGPKPMTLFTNAADIGKADKSAKDAFQRGHAKYVTNLFGLAPAVKDIMDDDVRRCRKGFALNVMNHEVSIQIKGEPGTRTGQFLTALKAAAEQLLPATTFAVWLNSHHGAGDHAQGRLAAMEHIQASAARCGFEFVMESKTMGSPAEVSFLGGCYTYSSKADLWVWSSRKFVKAWLVSPPMNIYSGIPREYRIDAHYSVLAHDPDLLITPVGRRLRDYYLVRADNVPAMWKLSAQVSWRQWHDKDVYAMEIAELGEQSLNSVYEKVDFVEDGEFIDGTIDFLVAKGWSDMDANCSVDFLMLELLQLGGPLIHFSESSIKVLMALRYQVPFEKWAMSEATLGGDALVPSKR